MSAHASFIRKFFATTIVRYGFVGGTGALIDMGLLFLFTDVFGIYYLSSAVAANTVSFIFRFVAHKYFSFKDHAPEDLHFQFVKYTLLYFGGMAATTGILYLLVEKAHLWYMAAQVLAILIVACASFFVYRYFVFKKQQ